MSITIKDIAKESGYAVGTVSRVLNNRPDVSEKARERIMEVVEKYNFRLNSNAKHLKLQASNSIAIIVKGSQNMLFASILGQMQGDLQDKGFDCLIYYINEFENELEEAIQTCRERRPMGILFLGSNHRYFEKQFASINVPCVMVTNSARDLDYNNLSSVSTDDIRAGKAAVEHLIQLGHKKIGILGGDLFNSVGAAAARFKGCKQAFKDNEIEFTPEVQYETSLFGIAAGYDAMNNLLKRIPDVTAVFAMSDVMALGAVRAIKDKGLRIPEDISIIGFDGIELAEFMVPKLTTIKQNKDEIAKRSVEILIERITQEKDAVHEVIPFQVVSGESTKQL